MTKEEWAYVEDWAFRASKWLLEEPDPEVGEEAEQVLRLIGVKVDDHRTWWLHIGGCDQQGTAPCRVRIDEMRAERRAEALLDSIAKETALREPRMRVGAYVTAWSGRRIGQIVKINKVSVKVRMIGSREDGHVITEKNLDPRYVSVVHEHFRAVPEVDDEVVLRDHGGYTRSARVVTVDGPLFEASYSIKNGEWRSAWFDVLCLKST